MQVFTEMLDRTKPKIQTPPSSGSDKDYPILDTLATVGYYTGKGLYHTGRLGLKAVDYMTRARDREDTEEDDEEETQPNTTTFLTSTTARQRSRSRDDYDNDASPEARDARDPASSSNAPPANNDMAYRLLRRGASRSRSSTPKGYPKKKK